MYAHKNMSWVSFFIKKFVYFANLFTDGFKIEFILIFVHLYFNYY